MTDSILDYIHNFDGFIDDEFESKLGIGSIPAEVNPESYLGLYYDINKLEEMLLPDFTIAKYEQTVIVPGEEEQKKYLVSYKKDPKQAQFWVQADCTVSYDEENKSEMLMKFVDTSNFPLHAIWFLKSFLRVFPQKNTLIGNIRGIYFGLNLNLLNENLDQYSTEELYDKFYIVLPDDHIMNKFENGGWEDENGVWHDWPEDSSE